MVKINKKLWKIGLKIGIGLAIINVAQANCLFNVGNLGFGNYQSPYQYTDVLSSSLISLSCDSYSTGNTLTIKMYQGQSPTFDRYLSSGKEQLYYNLYLDSSRSSVWGDGTNGTVVYNTTIQTKNDINIFSKVYKNQNVAPGNYQDNIVFEMNF